MPIINWDSRFSIHMAEIDAHHQHLFVLFNRLYDDFVGKASAQTLNALFDELIDYATYHFSVEERWMHDQGFPELEMHRKEHDLFSKRVLEMQQDYTSGRRNLTLEILSFLHNWLASHIQLSDVEFGAFYIAKNTPGSDAADSSAAADPAVPGKSQGSATT
jgi:hemerythrin